MVSAVSSTACTRTSSGSCVPVLPPRPPWGPRAASGGRLRPVGSSRSAFAPSRHGRRRFAHGPFPFRSPKPVCAGTPSRCVNTVAVHRAEVAHPIASVLAGGGANNRGRCIIRFRRSSQPPPATPQLPVGELAALAGRRGAGKHQVDGVRSLLHRHLPAPPRAAASRAPPPRPPSGRRAASGGRTRPPGSSLSAFAPSRRARHRLLLRSWSFPLSFPPEPLHVVLPRKARALISHSALAPGKESGELVATAEDGPQAAPTRSAPGDEVAPAARPRAGSCPGRGWRVIPPRSRPTSATRRTPRGYRGS